MADEATKKNLSYTQTEEYKNSVLPNNVRARIAVEAGVTDFWRKYVGIDGWVVGIDTFGESAPASDLYAHFDITVQAIVAAVKNVK